jgi:UDP-N-acetylmuramate: L-alanyl-gamma-D-glutamyl-meso-diaminopimelate ligase
MQMGCWSEQLGFSASNPQADFYLRQNILHQDSSSHLLELSQMGQFNALNASAAIIAARHAGVAIETSLEALTKYNGVKRRQEVIAKINGVTIIDDFAHHPTAIALTLQALKENSGGRLIAVLDIRSNTMKSGAHGADLGLSIADADLVLLCETPDLQWDMQQMAETAPTIVEIKTDTQQIIDYLLHNCQPGDLVVIMSNGGFDNIHQRLIQAMGN